MVATSLQIMSFIFLKGLAISRELRELSGGEGERKAEC